jgi:curved DNA-binding protein CbpA
VLSDPERRAKYDIVHTRHKQARWRLAASAERSENDFEAEQILRLTILELLYTRRRTEPDDPAISPLEIEQMTGRAREHLAFTVWYLAQKKFVTRSDSSDLVITADGVEHLEENYRTNLQRRRLEAHSSV